MPFVVDETPIVLEKLLEEMKNNGGVMSTEDFKRFLYNLRLTEDDLNNVDKKLKKSLLRTRFSKRDANDYKRWLNLNGYIIINHEYQKEVIILNDKAD